MSFEFASVLILLRVCCPSAIARFVVAIVVDPVERETGRFFGHIGEKVFKTISPSITHDNAATSVIFVIKRVFIVATSFHIRPRLKRAAPLSTNCVTMFEVYVARYFNQKASTRSGIATPQIACADTYFSAAGTATFPMDKRNSAGSALSVRDAENA
jgi:hypothetical protein